MKKIFFLLILLSIGLSLFPERIAVLHEPMKPLFILLFDNRLYISEEASISIYSMTNFKRLKKFGKKGAGPGEFIAFPTMKAIPGYLAVTTFNKFLLYSLDGDFIREERTPGPIHIDTYPIGKNYVCAAQETTGTVMRFTIFLCDEHFNTIKILAQEAEGYQRVKKGTGKRRESAFKDYLRHVVYKDSIYVGDTSKGFYIAVFDFNGRKRYEINNCIPRIPITREDKERFLNELRESNDWLDRMTVQRTAFDFAEFYPAFSKLDVSSDKLYATTYKCSEDDKNREIIILDVKGVILKRVFVPKVQNGFYSIANDRYYYLIDNDIDEGWELHMIWL